MQISIILSLIKRIQCGPGLFRFLLAFIVVIYHTVGAFPLGHYAVYVFFMLSGYWIFKMFEEKYSTYKTSYWVYLKSRLMRVIFVYWMVLIIGIIVFFATTYLTQNYSWQQFSLTEIFLKNIFIFGINQSPIMFIVPAWSLEVEIQFYVLVPLLVLIRKQVSIYGLILGSIALLIAYLTLIPLENRFSNIALYLPFFLVGAWLYYAQKVFSAKAANIGLLIGVFIIAVNFLVPALRPLFLVKTEPLFGAAHYQDQMNMVLALLTIPYLSRNITQKITDKFDGSWSSMSFILYLLHWPLLRVYTTILQFNGGQYHTIILALYILICVGLSYLLSISVDQYFESKRRAWLKQQPKAIAPLPVLVPEIENTSNNDLNELPLPEMAVVYSENKHQQNKRN
ncbi:MAG: acyltransferase family protein [Ferruginibacter sp.]